MHLFGVSDKEHYEKSITFWSDVYGFKMPSLKQAVVKDAQIITIPEESVVTNSFMFKEIDCLRCTTEEISSFDYDFCLEVKEDTVMTGLGSSFETYFNDFQLEAKVRFLLSVHFLAGYSIVCFIFDRACFQRILLIKQPTGNKLYSNLKSQ